MENRSPIEKARDIIRKNPSLIWYVKDIDGLDLASITEHVLNYGDWDQFKELISAVGINEVAKTFYEHAFRPRCNYRPEIKSFFTEVFKRNASGNFDRQTNTAFATN